MHSVARGGQHFSRHDRSPAVMLFAQYKRCDIALLDKNVAEPHTSVKRFTEHGRSLDERRHVRITAPRPMEPLE